MSAAKYEPVRGESRTRPHPRGTAGAHALECTLSLGSVRPGVPDQGERAAAMIGMVLVSHGHLADEFRAALEHVVGPQRQLQAISIGPDDDMEQRRKDIIDAVTKVDSGAGVVLLTDMFGGTPSNLAISVMLEGRVEVVAGANLPMLIKLASVRESASLPQAVAQAQDAGRKYIYVASRILNGK